MNNNIARFFLVTVAAALVCSCIKDLDQKPLSDKYSTADAAYSTLEDYTSGLAYIAAYYSFVSMNDAGASDLKFDDAGQSELLRQWINLNELTADSFKCTWGDDYLSDLQYGRWGASNNNALDAVYTRCVKGITLVNAFLSQTTDELIAARGQQNIASDIAQYRAEARFHRAMFYWILMDCFGNPPFPTIDDLQNGTLPKQIKRADLYAWLETELKELAAESSALAAYGEVAYPRPTKGSAMALLAEMYLNAQVYTGTAQWQAAKDAAEAVTKMGYTLAPVYENLFMQDNTTNGAAEQEFIFAIDYDKDHAQSWGGTTTMASAQMSEGANALVGKLLGLNGTVMPENWNGYHVAPDYVNRFELKNVHWDGSDFGYDRESSDKRAFFVNEGEEDFDQSSVSSGWRCWKFSGRYTDGHVNGSDVSNYKLSSMDFPIFRLAEMYLIYAEADARLNGGEVKDTQAIKWIKDLRDRAGVEMPDDITLDFLLDERARELMMEGHRRTDLIRYGYFTSMSFPWAYKAGVKSGKASLSSYRTIFPIIMSEINSNSNLEQNYGY